jgi:flavin-dependent dehydrogenase
MRAAALIVGAGPAGSATALGLRRLGLSAVVVERSALDDWRPGETLAGQAGPLVDALGVARAVHAVGPIASCGVRAVWGAAETYERSSMVDAHGGGWHLERPALDRALAGAAAEAGAIVLLRTRLVHLARDGTGWRAAVSSPLGERTVSAAVLVDASGRRAALLRVLGARRQRLDRLVGIIGSVPGPLGDRDGPHLLVEATEDGWWYSAPLPGARLVVAFLTDTDLLAGQRAADRFRTGLACTTATRRRCCASAPMSLRVRAASTAWTAAWPAGCLAVGDAASSLDPLSGAGMTRALADGLDAAEAIERHLSGDVGALERRAAGAAGVRQADAALRATTYGAERRWPSAPFWRRRHAADHGTGRSGVASGTSPAEGPET